MFYAAQQLITSFLLDKVLIANFIERSGENFRLRKTSQIKIGSIVLWNNTEVHVTRLYVVCSTMREDPIGPLFYAMEQNSAYVAPSAFHPAPATFFVGDLAISNEVEQKHSPKRCYVLPIAFTRGFITSLVEQCKNENQSAIRASSRFSSKDSPFRFKC